MYKKFIIAFLLLFIVFLVTGCNNNSSTTTTSEVPLSLTTTLHPDSLILNIPEECNGVEIIDGWIPTWCEEFKYIGGVNPSKWRHQIGGGGFGNNELQYYTNRPENAYVDGDKLIITAIKEEYNYHGYTSSKIWTQNIKNWKYGKFEVRAKVPAGIGTWPAFWMMPKNSVYGTWPKSGEIDILEHSALALNKAIGSIHTEKYNHQLGTQISFSKTDLTLTSEFHTYSVVWNEYSIAWYLDGLEYGKTIVNPNQNTDVETYAAWPFDQEFYLILNLAMGGSMGGTVSPSFISDTFEIDYVRVYQKDYGYNDLESPSDINNLQAVKAVNQTAYLIWTRSTDNQEVKLYHVYLNDQFFKSVSLNTLFLKNLTPGAEYKVEIEAEDYAGNRSARKTITFRTTIVS